jgi:hypothetical protein
MIVEPFADANVIFLTVSLYDYVAPMSDIVIIFIDQWTWDPYKP